MTSKEPSPRALPSLVPTLAFAPASAPPASDPPRPASGTVKLSPEALAAIVAPPAAAPADATPEPAPTAPPRSATTKLSIEQLIDLMRPRTASASRPAPPSAPTSAPPPAVTSIAPAPRHRARVAIGLAAFAALGALSFGVARAAVTGSTRWVAPTMLTKSDPRVLQVAATLQQESARKSELALRKKELETRLAETTRWLELESAFQQSFTTALKADLDGQRAELRRLARLVAERAGASSDAEPAPRDADADHLQAKLDAVRQRIRLLDAALREGRAGASYEALALRREFDRSRLEADKARELKDALAKALADTDDALRRKDALLASIEASPYRLAVDADVALGFVPYDNASYAREGAPLVACDMTLLFCHPVGTLGEALPGETRGTNPMSGQETRGQLVRLKLDDARAVERPTLFAGHSPFST